MSNISMALETKKDLFYEEQKREKQKAAMEESLRLKKKQEEEKQRDKENKKILDEVVITTQTTPTPETTAEETIEEEVNSVSIPTVPKNEQSQLSSENTVDEDLKKSLESVDPWMERKIEQNNENN